MSKELDYIESDENLIDDIMTDETFLENIDDNIEEILDKGLKKKQGFFNFLKSANKELGFKNIFNDKSELIFIGLILAITVILFGLQFNKSNSNDADFIYKFKAFNFTVSPIVYFIICSYSFINSKLNRTYEIQATCKYNFYSITAIRMFVFSIVSVLINMIIILSMYLLKRNFYFIDMFVVSAAALFIFSVLYILILIYFKKTMYKYLALLGWSLVSTITILKANNYWIKLFLDMPLYIHLFITIIFIIVYMKNLKKLMKVKRGDI